MGQKDVSTLVESTGGQLKYNRIIEKTITDSGTDNDANIDFTGMTFEGGRTKVNHIRIINDGGVNDVFFVFDALASTINTAEVSEIPTTYNGKAYAGSPFTEIGYDGEADSIGLRCAAGKSTTVKILIW